MIYDRTIEDVNAAIHIRETKIKKFENLTSEETASMERGTITISTLNRIENKQKEIKSLLSTIGINVEIKNKTWDETQIFDEINFQRILDNLNLLINSFCAYSSTPRVPKISYHYEDINSIEKILVDLEDLYNKTLKSFKYCGTLYCGQ